MSNLHQNIRTSLTHIKRICAYVASVALGIYAGYDGSALFGIITFLGCLLIFDASDINHLLRHGQKRPFWWFLLILVAFRTFLFDVMYVPSGSMTPTLLTGDFVLVKKAEYGFNKESLWPLGKLLPYLPSVSWKKPKNGEIVVWTRTNDPATMFYVKRAVAISNDKLQMINGILHINDVPATVEYKGLMNIWHDSGVEKPVQIFAEKHPSTNIEKLTIRDTDFGKALNDNTSQIILPKDHFAIVGDNRTNYGSHDSRDISTFPPMPYDQIIGKPKLVLFSTTSWAKYSKDVSWGTWIRELPMRFVAVFLYLRTDRFFKSVE